MDKQTALAELKAELAKLDPNDTNSWIRGLSPCAAFFKRFPDSIFIALESPFQGGSPEATELNVIYARKAFKHSLMVHGEIPFASHLLYTQDGILDDTIPAERALGISAGFYTNLLAHKTVLYIDLGISRGMLEGAKASYAANRPLVLRSLEVGELADSNLATARKVLAEKGITL